MLIHNDDDDDSNDDDDTMVMSMMMMMMKMEYHQCMHAYRCLIQWLPGNQQALSVDLSVSHRHTYMELR